MLFSLQVLGDFCCVSVTDSWFDSVTVREHNLCDFSSFKFNICLGDQDMFCLNIPSVQFSRSVVSDSVTPMDYKHARLPCPTPTPRTCSKDSLGTWKKMCILLLFSDVLHRYQLNQLIVLVNYFISLLIFCLVVLSVAGSGVLK